jgi:hypothetical protein
MINSFDVPVPCEIAVAASRLVWVYPLGSNALTCRVSEAFKIWVLRAFLFIFLDFFVRMWRILAGLYFTLPVPVKENRFLAPL